MSKLKAGDVAPDFSAESVNMDWISLGDYRGRGVDIVFGRYFGCPVCQMEFDELLEHAKRHPDTSLIYVTQSLTGSAKSYIEGRSVGFPVIAAERVGGAYPLYGLYGVGNMGPVALAGILAKASKARAAGKTHGAYEGNEMQGSAQFRVDAEGRIASAHYGPLDASKLHTDLAA